MRVTLTIDDKLMADALRLTGAKSKREVVELGLLTLLHLSAQEEIRRYRGKLPWLGNRTPPPPSRGRRGACD